MDHSPVGVFLNRQTYVMQPQHDLGVDRNRLMRCVLRGENRFELFEAIARDSNDAEIIDMVTRAKAHKSSSLLYHAIVKTLHTSMTQTFPKHKKMSPRNTEVI